jgi:hypothetical protein
VIKPLAGQTEQTWHSLACAIKTEGKTVRVWGPLQTPKSRTECRRVRASFNSTLYTGNRNEILEAYWQSEHHVLYTPRNDIIHSSFLYQDLLPCTTSRRLRKSVMEIIKIPLIKTAPTFWEIPHTGE